MSGDFGGLGAIVEEARALDDDNASRPLIDCPRCGTRLERNSAGVANCPMGHFTTSAPTQGG